MNPNTSGIKNQSGDCDNLTPRQRQLLSYFDATKELQQDFILRFTEQLANDFPCRNAPKLRLVAGGAC